MEEEVTDAVVGHQEVRPAVVIYVTGHDPQGLGFGSPVRVRNLDAGPGGNVQEPTAADVAVEEALRPLEAAGRPIGPRAGDREILLPIDRGRPGDIVAHE